MGVVVLKQRIRVFWLWWGRHWREVFPLVVGVEQIEHGRTPLLVSMLERLGTVSDCEGLQLAAELILFGPADCQRCKWWA
jgi:hypothetical protein